jgi:hypothetical protein
MDCTSGLLVAMERTKAKQLLQIVGDFELEPIGAIEVVDQLTAEDATFDYDVIVTKRNTANVLMIPNRPRSTRH